LVKERLDLGKISISLFFLNNSTTYGNAIIPKKEKKLLGEKQHFAVMQHKLAAELNRLHCSMSRKCIIPKIAVTHCSSSRYFQSRDYKTLL